MNELLKEAVEQLCAEEYVLPKNVPEHRFSLKHRRKMNKIFGIYEREIERLRVKQPQIAYNDPKFKLTRKNILIALLALFLAILTGCAIHYFTSTNFRGIVHKTDTELFPINTENCPETIEEKYYLSELPEGFKKEATNSSPFHEFVGYINKETGQTITFSQWPKSVFGSIHYNTEKGTLEEIEINGCYGVILDTSNQNGSHSTILWDNGDYIFEISANLSKNEIINLAKSAKVEEI